MRLAAGERRDEVVVERGLGAYLRGSRTHTPTSTTGSTDSTQRLRLRLETIDIGHVEGIAMPGTRL